MSTKKKKVSQSKLKSMLTRCGIDNVLLLPLLIIIAIIPLVVRMRAVTTGLNIFPWYSAQEPQADFFLSAKSNCFILMSVIMTILIIWYLYDKFLKKNTHITLGILDNETKFTYELIPLFIYGLLCLISTIFSNYSTFGYKGILNQFESIFVLLGYCIAVYYAFIFINSESDIHNLFNWLLASSIILTLLGLTQATGHDFFSSSFGKHLIIPSKYWDLLEQVTFTFEKNRVYLTLYNPNYVGLYTSLVLPIFIVLFAFSKQKLYKSLYGFAIIGLVFCIVGSSSRNAFVAIIVALMLMIILFRKYILKKWKLVTLSSLMILSMFFVANMYMNNSFIQRIESILNFSPDIPFTLSSLITNNDSVELVYNNNKLSITASPGNENLLDFTLVDNSGKKLETSLDNSTGLYIIHDERFSSIQLQQATLNEINCFGLIIDGTSWFFSNETGDGSYYYLNPVGKFEKIIHADSAVFSRYENLGSGRGYIWSRTIPLLKNSLILGTGADTFTLVFPQNDYLGRFHHNYLDSIISKPHNLFLQIGVQTGVPSLIAIIFFYLIYFLTSIKLYINNNFETYFSQAGSAIFIGSVGYMISSIFNDSTVAVSPIFWVLIGCGIAINYRVKIAARINSLS